MAKTIVRLTWRDGVASLVTFAAVALYWAFLAGADLPFVGGPRGLSVALMVLGVTGCALGASQSPVNTLSKRIGVVLGPIALIAFVITVITASEITLGLFMAAFVLLWAATTAQHAFGRATPSDPVSPPQKTVSKVG